jgi:hypothetical protein
MSEQKAVFRNWGSEVLRHWRAGRAEAHERSREAACHGPREPQQLERIAACACSGYFHVGYVHDPFVFTAEVPFND